MSAWHVRQVSFLERTAVQANPDGSGPMQWKWTDVVCSCNMCGSITNGWWVCLTHFQHHNPTCSWRAVCPQSEDVHAGPKWKPRLRRDTRQVLSGTCTHPPEVFVSQGEVCQQSCLSVCRSLSVDLPVYQKTCLLQTILCLSADLDAAVIQAKGMALHNVSYGQWYRKLHAVSEAHTSLSVPSSAVCAKAGQTWKEGGRSTWRDLTSQEELGATGQRCTLRSETQVPYPLTATKRTIFKQNSRAFRVVNVGTLTMHRTLDICRGP